MRFQSDLANWGPKDVLPEGMVEIPEERFLQLVRAFALKNSGNENPDELDLRCEFEVLDDYNDVLADNGRYFVKKGILAALLPA